MAEQNKVTQAVNSVETAHNAVAQAEEHPSDRMLEQAEQSLRHANASVGQAFNTGHTEAASRLNEQLEEDREVLE
ncbi:hypothetical protein [Paenibacillus xerothermodurans]|uniref:DUF2564 family protein n=1 Tax=Paenibacillus xerothermodurans TaxID=1977292 RepID=A0A2W1N7L6_PAEXE|nr:hypothetical protein [Paenibacillus xerothermodurans]PZE19570.1 hypothetical protein CBW46_017790 [Paenibacillus xerothermodurans]